MGIEVRRARPGDGAALAGIHGDMGEYYATLAPEHFRRPRIDGLAAELDTALAEDDGTALHLVAERGGEVVASLYARIVAGSDDAEREITPDSAVARLRIDYVATAAAHRRSGAASELVAVAERWGRQRGATVAETWTYHRSPLSVPFWTERMGYEERSVNLRKPL